MIIINFKAYGEAAGINAAKLADICSKVAKNHKANIILVPQYTDINELRSKGLPIFAQHIDAIENAGAFTGHLVAENLKESGISGTLINHSEKRIPKEEIRKCIAIAKSLRLVSICCAATPEEAGEIASFSPDYIAIEPPELIGSGVSVSTARPEIVTKSVAVVRKINPAIKVLCGAGITNGADVEKALELGAKGILVASGVVKSADPEKILIELSEALNKLSLK